MSEEKARKAKRGFAAMSPERRRAIASQGGRAVQEQGVGHQWDFAEAQAAGRKGGRSFSANNLQLKNLVRQRAATMVALFVPLLMTPLLATHFLTAASICKRQQDKNDGGVNCGD